MTSVVSHLDPAAGVPQRSVGQERKSTSLAMSPGPKQHIVPVQMIRRFANSDGRLFCLKKVNLEIPDRVHGNLPRKILYRRHYYEGGVSDLDEEWIKPREDAFANLYPTLADEKAEPKKLNSEEGRVFIEWVTSLQYRSELVREAVDATNSTAYMKQRTGVTIGANDLANIERRMLAEESESLYNSPGWVWTLKVLNMERSMVLSDQPVCHTMVNDPIGPAVFVPLSKTRLIVGSTREGLEKLKQVSVDQVNLFMASWSNKLIYADSVGVLETVAEHLRGADERARLPFYGVIERMRTQPVPRVPGEKGSVFDYMKKVIAKGDTHEQL